MKTPKWIAEQITSSFKRHKRYPLLADNIESAIEQARRNTIEECAKLVLKTWNESLAEPFRVSVLHDRILKILPSPERKDK